MHWLHSLLSTLTYPYLSLLEETSTWISMIFHQVWWTCMYEHYEATFLYSVYETQLIQKVLILTMSRATSLSQKWIWLRAVIMYKFSSIFVIPNFFICKCTYIYISFHHTNAFTEVLFILLFIQRVVTPLPLLHSNKTFLK